MNGTWASDGHRSSRTARTGPLGDRDHLAEHPRIGDERCHRLVDDERRAGDRIARVDRFQRLGQDGHHPVDQRVHHVVAGADQVVHGGGRDAGECGDLLGAHLVGVPFGEQGGGSVEDRVAASCLALVTSTHVRSATSPRLTPLPLVTVPSLARPVRCHLDVVTNLELTPNMRHDVQVRLIEQLCAHLDAGTTVDAGGLRRMSTDAYVDPDLAEHEWREFFRAVPQCLGLSGDLPEPGSFLTNDDLGIPILATRDADGVFRAFVNACRHRGAKVEFAERGTTRRFTCAFHSWVYDSARRRSSACPGPNTSVTSTGRASGCVRCWPRSATDCCSCTPIPRRRSSRSTLLDHLLGDVVRRRVPHVALRAHAAAHARRVRHGVQLEAGDGHVRRDVPLLVAAQEHAVQRLPRQRAAARRGGPPPPDDPVQAQHRRPCATCPKEQWDITVAALPVYWIFPNAIVMPFDAGVFLVRAYPNRTDPAAT